MRWWQWLLLWIGLACLLAALAGSWISRVAQQYPPVEEEE